MDLVTNVSNWDAQRDFIWEPPRSYEERTVGTPHPTPHGKKRSIAQELSRIVNALMFPGLHMQQNDYMSLFATTASRVKNRDQDDAKWSTRFFPRILLVYCYN